MKTVMSNEKVAFTGHRSIPFATINVLRQRISDCVENLYLSGKTEYLCGMALGFDLLCAEVVLSLKKRFPDIRLICVLPYRRSPKCGMLCRERGIVSFLTRRMK